ncbi:hypothetical protein [Aquitalea sp.]|uniref:hypothetical protein n=1 Tax=Aquitalea sp. TaxID=1872623 RepID=UPI00258C1EFF|nr:hypothetical protein [Aquitalea sp.]
MGIHPAWVAGGLPMFFQAVLAKQGPVLLRGLAHYRDYSEVICEKSFDNQYIVSIRKNLIIYSG